ncbi:UDP-N-acetylmuramoyl-L-alanyl-D-glutamate--2,6-diaminopimelate ligase [Paracidovorax anthurii]|uniref:UDP-N-acetylmuramoyl-L-alanyl-D-glutamate--2,6-diaminopimelate ligase n=1 Tax=Paracidovorax anthurii TaxID=78229 RepID=A0A328ZJN1_9BURK|nr:UDP-N-acetylmuramoyl-L-alanyl-D-glutamate--2,6-diaminopimelate ligase [Paracidovorax anthurii]RAR85844.1 UDP-N-acetylmuramoylalanyl-D-glutamate--2,6-diaminopimelate ligase [Paracidovorax anthurii]
MTGTAVPQPPLLGSVHEALEWLRARVTQGTLRTDSRQVQPGDAFVAWPGAATDGRMHVGEALARGAVACLVEHEGVEAFRFGADGIAALHGLKAATGLLAAEWFGLPAQRLDVIAVTGTNGKTSTTWWLADALNLLSQHGLSKPGRCGIVGTLGLGVPPELESTGLTTPDPVRLQRAFAALVEAGDAACAIEASSIGLAEHRLAGTRIRAAVFTNFSQDHLDYHPGMAAYWQAKSALFDWPGLQAAIVNIDDPRGAELADALAQRPLDLWTTSIAGPARLQARDIAWGEGGLRFTVAEGVHTHVLQTRVIGHYNIHNLLAVAAALRALGVPLEHALWACAQLSPVPGRMELIHLPGQPLVAVDYAHTPDALDQALQALRPVAAERGGRLWCVFGCGGNRDRAKRPLMGRIAQQRADAVIVTSDNPRNEDPAAILQEILRGTAEGALVRAEPDREVAIARALADAGTSDVVLIAGKGHEDYQEAAGVRRPFSDAAHARAALGLRDAGGAAPTEPGGLP